MIYSITARSKSSPTQGVNVAVKKVDTPADFDAMMDRVQRSNAPAWRPNPGGKLRGTPVHIALSPADRSEYGEYPIVTFKQENGEYINFHAFHTMAREHLRERATTLKAAIANPDSAPMWNIIYLEERVTNDTRDRDPKDQTTYHLYYTEVDGEVTGNVTDVFDFTAL